MTKTSKKKTIEMGDIDPAVLIRCMKLQRRLDEAAGEHERNVREALKGVPKKDYAKTAELLKEFINSFGAPVLKLVGDTDDADSSMKRTRRTSEKVSREKRKPKNAMRSKKEAKPDGAGEGELCTVEECTRFGQRHNTNHYRKKSREGDQKEAHTPAEKDKPPDPEDARPPDSAEVEVAETPNYKSFRKPFGRKRSKIPRVGLDNDFRPMRWTPCPYRKCFHPDGVGHSGEHQEQEPTERCRFPGCGRELGHKMPHYPRGQMLARTMV